MRKDKTTKFILFGVLGTVMLYTGNVMGHFILGYALGGFMYSLPEKEDV